MDNQNNSLGLSDIDNIVNILDSKVEAGISRIKIEIDEDREAGSISERYHHGRCDIASPFDTGCIPTFDEENKL